MNYNLSMYKAINEGTIHSLKVMTPDKMIIISELFISFLTYAYVMGAQKNCLIETVLLSTHSISSTQALRKLYEKKLKIFTQNICTVG